MSETSTKDAADTQDSGIVREVARAMFLAGQLSADDAADAEARKAQWETDKKDHMRMARQVIRRLKHKGLSITRD